MAERALRGSHPETLDPGAFLDWWKTPELKPPSLHFREFRLAKDPKPQGILGLQTGQSSIFMIRQLSRGNLLKGQEKFISTLWPIFHSSGIC